jgi:hypothetical protein
VDVVKRGTAVSYRAIAGDVLDGVLACDVRPDGTVAVDVSIPGCREPLHLSKVLWRDGPTKERYAAWPKQ